jgi:hypothetical protein
MRRVVRGRLELLSAGGLAVLAVVTAIWPTWIESVLEVSPDGGSGGTEWWLVVVLAVAAIGAAALARRDLRAAPA